MKKRRPHLTKSEIKTVRNHYREGMEPKAIAKLFKLAPTSIYRQVTNIKKKVGRPRNSEPILEPFKVVAPSKPALKLEQPDPWLHTLIITAINLFSVLFIYLVVHGS